MASVVLRAARVKREKMVSQVSRVIWVSKETGVNLGRVVQEVKMALKAQKVALVPMVTLAHLVLLVKRENLVFQGCPGIQEDKVQRAPLVSLDFQEPMERKVPGVL